MDQLSFGYPIAILQNVAYALPAAKATVFTDAATPTIIQSNTPTFVGSAAVTLLNNSATLGAKFIKCTSGNITITLSRD